MFQKHLAIASILKTPAKVPMDTINGLLCFPLHGESFNQDLAITRFCPARIEQEQGEWEEAMNEIELFSPCDDAISTPRLAAFEVDEFVDSFINIDHEDHIDDDDNINKSSLPEKQESFTDNFAEEIEAFSTVNDVYGDQVSMILEGDDHQLVMNTTVSSSEQDHIGVVPGMVPSVEEVSHGVDQGLHLVHLLLACAEAVGCRDIQLADSMLSQIWASANPWGDSLQRVSYCFAAMGLKARLSLLHNVNANGTFTNAAMDVSLITREEKIEAFQLLYQTTPYIAFGFMAANEAICQAAQGKRFLHIIDLGMEHTLQWPSLLSHLIFARLFMLEGIIICWLTL